MLPSTKAPFEDLAERRVLSKDVRPIDVDYRGRKMLLNIVAHNFVIEALSLPNTLNLCVRSGKQNLDHSPFHVTLRVLWRDSALPCSDHVRDRLHDSDCAVSNSFCCPCYTEVEYLTLNFSSYL